MCEHLHPQDDTRRNRLDLNVSASNRHRNHITATSFRRSSESGAPPSKPSLFFSSSTRRRASSLFESSSDKTQPPTQRTRKNNQPDPKSNPKNLKTATIYLKPTTQSYDSLHHPETRTDDGETEEASTSRRQEPAAAKLWKPPPPRIRTQTTIVFTAPTLQATASSLQDQNHHGRWLARAKTRRTLEETKRRQLRTN
ncbi:hypothetical protein HID58_021983 [Brassica napus]|uniref:Uncharacterized protein n=1 Tax=Brassica napus TaxID=3708 RepID=A0ABQ8CXY2_BRANA|nr:hypothetical protein HID58_021983 [Brassica napus]